MTRIRDFFKGVVSLTFTLILLVGVPAFLAIRYAWPFDDIADVLTDELASDTTIVETLLINGLVVIAWAAWLMIAVSIVTEAIALARGVAARRLPVLPGIQHGAARLVASCALVVSSFSAAMPAAAVPIVPLDLTAPMPANVLLVDDPTNMRTGSATVDAAATPSRSAAAASGAVYPVEHGDTFWSIAERLLGDGLRWKEIVTLNDGAVMDDGSVITRSTQSPKAGWHLALPDDAVMPLGTAPVQAPPSAPSAAHLASDREDRIRVGDTDETWNVERGDHFWKISKEALTEAWGRTPTNAEIHPFWIETIELNRDRLLPPKDPNLIYPQQTFLLPEIDANPQAALGDDGTMVDPNRATGDVTVGTPTEAPVEAPVDGTAEAPAEVPADDPVAVAPQPPIGAPAVPGDVNEPAAVLPNIPVPEGPYVPAQPVPVEEPTGPVDSDLDAPPADIEEADTSSGLSDLAIPAIIVSGLGLLSAGLLSIVNRLRARRIGERQPGKAPKFQPPHGVEAELQRNADPDARDDLNRALRYLGTKLSGLAPAPTIVGLSVETKRIVVLLDEPHPNAPAPFAAEHNVWTLDRTIELPDVPSSAIAPVPALVTIGHTTRSQLLLDLEHAGIVNITGTRADVKSTMATMALELAASRLADQLDIICVGFGSELKTFERVTVSDSLDDVAQRIRSHAAEVADLAGDELTAVAGRVREIGGDTWTPLVVFAPDAEATAALLTEARRTNGAGVTALVTSDGAATWQLHVKGNQIQIPHISVTVRRRNLTPEQLAAACDLVDDARNPQIVDVVDLVETIHETTPGGAVAGNGHQAPAAEDLWEATEPYREPTAASAPLRPTWDVDYVVEILGKVRVTDRAGAEMHFDRSASAELLAYLVRHRNGVTTDTAMEAMYPNQAPAKNRMYNLASCARKTLGTTPDGEDYVPRATEGVFYVTDRVGCDYDHFTDLVAYASKCEPSEAVAVLREALEMVRGEPFTGRGLDWASISGDYTEVALAVDEAARAMATIALDELDRPDEAAWATRQGLAVNPRSTELHLLRLRAALARDDGGIEPDAVFQQYRTVMEADDTLPEGVSYLDDRVVNLYEAHRLSNPRRWADTSTA